MLKCLTTLSMIALICGLGVRNAFADDPEEVVVSAQRQDGNRGEFEVAIKRLTAQLKELKNEAAELKKANKPDRFDLAQNKFREAVEKLEALKSRLRKSQDKPKPRREVRRRKEVRRVRERRREVEPRREREREQRTEVDAAIEKTRAKYNALKKKAEDLARTDKNDAKERVVRQLREMGGKLEKLMGDRIRRLAAQRKGGERRERDVRRNRGERREGERGERREGERRARGERRVEHPEIRAAVNRLEHMRAAIGHLKEAGLKELAQAAGERAEKLQDVIERSRKAMAERRERSESEEREEKDRDSDGDGNGAMREIGQTLRQLSNQLKELRKEVNSLKKKVENRK